VPAADLRRRNPRAIPCADPNLNAESRHGRERGTHVPGRIAAGFPVEIRRRATIRPEPVS